MSPPYPLDEDSFSTTENSLIFFAMKTPMHFVTSMAPVSVFYMQTEVTGALVMVYMMHHVCCAINVY